MPPMGEDDVKGAERVCEEFFILYQPTFTRIERYLDTIVNNTDEIYANAYTPWQQALRDMIRGLYLIVKKIPLPNYEPFIEAINIFSFDSAIQFLHDLCIGSNIKLQKNWEEKFREHIDILLFSVTLLHRQTIEHGVAL